MTFGGFWLWALEGRGSPSLTCRDLEQLGHAGGSTLESSIAPLAERPHAALLELQLLIPAWIPVWEKTLLGERAAPAAHTASCFVQLPPRSM